MVEINNLAPGESVLSARLAQVLRLTDVDPTALIHPMRSEYLPHLVRLFVETNGNGGYENDPTSDFQKAFPMREEDKLKAGIVYVRIHKLRRSDYASAIESYLWEKGYDPSNLKQKAEYVRSGTSEIVYVPYFGYTSKTLQQSLNFDIHYSQIDPEFHLRGLQKFLWSRRNDFQENSIDYEVIPLIYVGEDERFGKVMTTALIAMAGIQNLSNQTEAGAMGYQNTSPDEHVHHRRFYVNPHI